MAKNSSGAGDYLSITTPFNIFGDTNGSYTIGATSGPVPTVWPQRNMEIKDKEQVIALINARIATLAQKAARLARLREFFENMTSKQEDVVKDFWETVKKELD